MREIKYPKNINIQKDNAVYNLIKEAFEFIHERSIYLIDWTSYFWIFKPNR